MTSPVCCSRGVAVGSVPCGSVASSRAGEHLNAGRPPCLSRPLPATPVTLEDHAAWMMQMLNNAELQSVVRFLTRAPPVVVGTAFSGLETPIIALRHLASQALPCSN